MSRKIPKISVNFSWGVVILVCFFALNDAVDLIVPFFVAAAIHEVGHLVAIYLAGGSVSSVLVNAGGIKIEHNSSDLSYGREIICLLSGPILGIAAAVVAAKLRLYLFSGISFVMSTFNLLPARPLDGGQAMFCLISFLSSPYTADKLCKCFDLTVFSLILIAGFLVMYKTGSITLAFMGAVMCIYYCKER